MPVGILNVGDPGTHYIRVPITIGIVAFFSLLIVKISSIQNPLPIAIGTAIKNPKFHPSFTSSLNPVPCTLVMETAGS